MKDLSEPQESGTPRSWDGQDQESTKDMCSGMLPSEDLFLHPRVRLLGE